MRDPEGFLSFLPKAPWSIERVHPPHLGWMYTIEVLTRHGWSQTEEHEQRDLAELQAALKSQADGQTYRVSNSGLSTLCVFTQNGSSCWELDSATAA